MNKITINGITTVVSGKNIKVRDISNSRVSISVDGVQVYETSSRELVIKFEGDLASLDSVHAQVTGNIHGKVDTTHLNITGNITGDVDSTHVNVKGDIIGNVDGTHIHAKNVRGNIIV